MKQLDVLISHCKKPTLSAWLFACTFLLLSACSQTPIQETLPQPDWNIGGKIGYKQGLLKGGSATFTWTQQEQHYILHLFNPLGQAELSIKGNQNSAFAISANRQTFIADTPEELMQEITGWSFPVAAVKQWLQGKTFGNERDLEYNSEQQLQSFNTPIWQVKIDKYKTVGDKIYPHRIKLSKEDLRLTIIIKQHHQNFF